MFKLVVLCVFAAAVAEPEPGFLYGAPLAYASYPSVIPATTTITKQSSVIAHPSPIYSTPYAYTHFIKKRSADPEPEANPEPEAKPDPQLLSYSAPSLYYPNTLSSPVINPFYPGYTGYSGYSGYSAYPYQANYPLATHLIKKRSAQFIAPTTYVPSTYAVPSYNPYYPTTYLGNKFYPGATFDTAVYGQHLIKKRSAVLPYTTPYVTPYTIPSTYYGNSYYPAVPTTYLGNNYYPGAAVVGLHSIKKRSAQVLAAPTFYSPTTTYAGAAPLYTSTYTAASPLVSSYPYVASYPYSTYIKK